MAIPKELIDVLMLGALNPGSIGVGYAMGRRANERQKLVVVAFAAGLAGAAFSWLLMALGFFEHAERLLVGIFVVSGVCGALWGALGFLIARMHRETVAGKEAAPTDELSP
ncbi:MAG: hypothetical protein JSS20_13100 [Proteobacteria bacterium]|nr:hypothetical protein [Pseudomonadota bacterium]